MGRGASFIGWPGALALVVMAVGSFIGLFVVGADVEMGEVQRLMYVHVPAAWTAFVAFFAVFIGSVLYLVQRDERADRVAASAAEVGVVFISLTLATGMLWGKPTWGVWWTWDPRLTTTALLLAVFVGYLAVRGFADDPERRARWSAIVGILGFVQVPIVYLSVVWWRSIHQPPSSPRSVSSDILGTWMLNFAAFLLVFAWLTARRARAARLEAELETRMAYD
ncbi:MAG TPA: cytochrome c biogenesis protein CcsA [Gemmatimonadota bacterium]|nr:cytochrome c biogenesis protein CcsA [Gemmatimonadota bacterium]